MQTQEKSGTVIFVATRSPEPNIQQDIEAHGLKIRWAPSIEVADGLLRSAPERTVIVTELALADGNWRDLVERVRYLGTPIPIVLLSAAITAELWWDALECGVEDILHRRLAASLLSQLMERHFGQRPR